MDEIITQVRSELKANADPKNVESAQNFFKEPIKLYGVTIQTASKIASNYFDNLKDRTKEEVFALCEELLKSGYFEEAWIAFEWSDHIHKQFIPRDFDTFENWIDKYISNWAACDTLCNHTVGSFIEMYPQYSNELLKWAHSKNRWFRRAASVSLILPARKGKFIKDVLKIAEILLQDEDDLVQKGYGWMLKEASREHQQQVFDYIMKRKTKMPRTALRYAIEKMPETLQEMAMAKDSE